MICNDLVYLPRSTEWTETQLQKLPEDELPICNGANFQFGRNEVTVEKESNLTVKDLKQRIANDLNIELIKKIKIIFKGKVLKDDFPLNELDTQDASLLHIILPFS